MTYYRNNLLNTLYRVDFDKPGIHTQQYIGGQWLDSLWIDAHELSMQEYEELTHEEVFTELI